MLPPCKEVESWTFSGLVGAYLDLGIAFLLLCASGLAYFTSKFLGLFGLALPCPCNGLFGDPNARKKKKQKKCWQRAVVGGSRLRNVSAVQCKVKTRFPFGAFVAVDRIGKRKKKGRDERRVGLVVAGDTGNWVFGGQKKREGGLRGRRKCGGGAAAAFDDDGRTGMCASSSSVSTYNPFMANGRALLHQSSPASVTNIVKEKREVAVGSSAGGDDAIKFSNVFESTELGDEIKCAEKGGAYQADELEHHAQDELCFDADEQSRIRFLELVLEEERAARATLYLELEKERSAAASAADEAMAMILRLQEEKALIEMDARQFRTIVEEKSAYDSEEMNILKEMFLWREREKHFLEKEVEAYRQIILGSHQLEADVQDIGITGRRRASSMLSSSEDPVPMLQRITESIGEKEKVDNSKTFLKHGVASIKSRNCTLAFGKELAIPEFDEAGTLKKDCTHEHPSDHRFHGLISRVNEGISEEYHEELISQGNSKFDEESDVQRLEEYSQGENLLEKTISPVGEIQEQSQTFGSREWLASKDSETKTSSPCNHDGSMKHRSDSPVVVFDLGHGVHDVLVENSSEKLAVNASPDMSRTCQNSTMRRSNAELDIGTSCSDITGGLLLASKSRGRPLLSDLRRNSMSAVDYEKFRIHNEVGWLRERLRKVKEGREKLNFSIGHMEKERNQLQLFDNIVNQLWEVRQLKEPGKAHLQNSLRPPFQKATSKKSRWRSVSFGMHRSIST